MIIPTRDEGEVLETCIRSMVALASNPDQINYLVLDNRSQERVTQEVFDRLAKIANITVVRVDEPFNWSRLNNVGASHAEGDILAFVNNDIEMQSQNWDSELRAALSDPSVGAVGARLLYPDGTLQHVGIVLGAVGGRPIHEGRGAPATDDGLLGRWFSQREASAVTGAFLAVRAGTFAEINGFEERLSIAYNDLDFCFRVRAAGLRVLYHPQIEATHYESKTRGLALTSEKIAWDDEEFLQLFRIWGEACQIDPYVSPCWSFAAERILPEPRPISLKEIEQALSGDPLMENHRRKISARSIAASKGRARGHDRKRPPRRIDATTAP
ncbi:hypothetical protein BZG35_03900 [Brevundimonas sp. LM2]|nr:hypothetical protein BZG35_03900 [Brevundimonas sp. LM2]